MGFSKLEEVVQNLTAGGLRAQRGFPVEVMPQLQSVAAAVQLAAISPEQTRVAVQILSPLGAASCENGAEVATAVLSDMGALYQVEECRFDSEIELFTCRVTGIWNTSTNCTVKVGSKNLEYLTSVSVRRTVSREQVYNWELDDTVEECADQGWNITMVELLPADSMPDVDVDEEFAVYIFRPDGYERYNECRWVQIALESVANGLRRTRVARTWEDRMVFD